MPNVFVKYEDYCGQNYGGYYERNSRTIVVVENKDWDSSKRIASTIAHEYRHHIQRTLNKLHVPNILVPEDIFTNYNSAIRRYFRSSISELDALLYEYKLVKHDMAEWWLKALVLSNNMNP